MSRIESAEVLDLRLKRPQRRHCWVPLQTAFELNRPEVVVGCAHDWAPP
jgi:hypothetical protein